MNISIEWNEMIWWNDPIVAVVFKVSPYSILNVLSSHFCIKMDYDYVSSDEEEVYMRIKSEEEEITDLHDLRSDLERFQQVYDVILAHDK